MSFLCGDCGGPVHLDDVNFDDESAFELYVCDDELCGNTGTYLNEYGVPGGQVVVSGLRRA